MKTRQFVSMKIAPVYAGHPVQAEDPKKKILGMFPPLCDAIIWYSKLFFPEGLARFKTLT